MAAPATSRPDCAESPSVSAQLFARARHVMPTGYTRDFVAAKPHPNYAAFGKGCWIEDVDGNRRIDWVNNFASLIHGHARQEIVDVIQQQAPRLLAAVLPTEWEVKLAETLCARIPSLDQVRFTNTGTEANQIITKAARAITGKPKMAKVEGGYHGQYDLLEASFQPSAPDWGPPERPRPVAHNAGTPQSLLDELVIVPFNDIENTRAILRAEADQLAAIILDPWRLQVNMVEPDRAYLDMLREETSRLGILLIFDEVVSLRASYHGAQGLQGVTPDLTTMGKIIGGGLPIGGFGGRREYMSIFDIDRTDRKVKHSGTFTANPMSMAAGFTSMSLLTPASFDDLNAKSARLREGLRRAHRDLRLPGRIEGSGSFTALMLTDHEVRNYRDLARAMQSGMMDLVLRITALLVEQGIFTLRGNFIGSTAMTDDDVDFTIAGATRALSKLRDG